MGCESWSPVRLQEKGDFFFYVSFRVWPVKSLYSLFFFLSQRSSGGVGAGSSLVCRLFSGCSWVGATLAVLCGLRILRLLLLWHTCSMAFRLQSLQLPGSRAQAQQLWHRGVVAPTHVGPSQARDQTRFSCTGSGFFTTEPPGKPWYSFLNFWI